MLRMNTRKRVIVLVGYMPFNHPYAKEPR